MANIQKADPQARRKAIKVIIIGALVGTALFFLLQAAVGNVNQWIESNAVFLVEYHYLAFLIMLALVAPGLALSIYLIRFAGKIVSSGRFPPPDTPVIRDVRILEGKQAILRGRLVQFLCWIILLALAAIPLLIWYIFFTVSCVS